MRKVLLLFVLTLCPAVCARAHMLLPPPAASSCPSGPAARKVGAPAGKAAVTSPPAKPQPARAARLEAPPAADGRFAEGVWERAVEDFYTARGGDNVATSRASGVLVAFDSHILVLRAAYQFTRSVFARALPGYESPSPNARGLLPPGKTPKTGPKTGPAFHAGPGDDTGRAGFDSRPAGLGHGTRHDGQAFFVELSDTLWRGSWAGRLRRRIGLPAGRTSGPRDSPRRHGGGVRGAGTLNLPATPSALPALRR